ncbi:MAG: hypothetical protein Q4G45_12755 [Actinomycetia bacterium]|nr:hypothetical protein [Actinomycetes bacterium]
MPILRARGFAPAAFGPVTPTGFRELTTTDGTAEVVVASRTDLRVSIDVPVSRR